MKNLVPIGAFVIVVVLFLVAAEKVSTAACNLLPCT